MKWSQSIQKFKTLAVINKCFKLLKCKRMTDFFVCFFPSVKPGFHVSGKSQAVWNFLLFPHRPRFCQVMKTRNRGYPRSSVTKRDQSGVSGAFLFSRCVPDFCDGRRSFLTKYKLKFVPSGTSNSAMDFYFVFYFFYFILEVAYSQYSFTDTYRYNTQWTSLQMLHILIFNIIITSAVQYCNCINFQYTCPSF